MRLVASLAIAEPWARWMSTNLRHAGHLADVTGTIEVFELGVAVSVHPALIC